MGESGEILGLISCFNGREDGMIAELGQDLESNLGYGQELRQYIIPKLELEQTNIVEIETGMELGRIL